MASADRSRRFRGSREDLSFGKSEIDSKVKIVNALTKSTTSDIKALRDGLAKEIANDLGLSHTWKAATKFFNDNRDTRATLRTSHPDEYHIALVTYALEGFYDTFNRVCRELESIVAAATFPYRHYYKILTLAVMNVQGYPQGVVKKAPLLYRGCSFKFEGLKVGEIFGFYQFTSTSTDPSVATWFGDGTVFAIKNIWKSGTDASVNLGRDKNTAINVIAMSHHSPYDEKEVLIWALEIFKVEAIQKEKNTTTVTLLA